MASMPGLGVMDFSLGATPGNGQGGEGRKQEMLQDMVQLCSYLKELETQAHLIHLNYEGSNFMSIHAFLKEQYLQHLDQFDTVAELVRTMDMYMPMCSCGLKDQVSPCFQNVQSYAGVSMLSVYIQNLEMMGMMAKDLEKTAQAVDAPDVVNYMAELVGAAFKASWFLKASLRC